MVNLISCVEAQLTYIFFNGGKKNKVLVGIYLFKKISYNIFYMKSPVARQNWWFEVSLIEKKCKK